jgi:L-seryl-tRNA(Ser) seleniumtransferase
VAPQLAARLPGCTVEAVACQSEIGSGALPTRTLPSHGIAIKAPGGKLNALAAAFRALPVPVIGRIQDGALVLDLRCLDDEAGFVAQLGGLAA